MQASPRERILIVDDEPQVRASLARLARQQRFDAVLAASAEEAIALAETAEFVAVITDVRMPGMGGLSLLHRLSPLLPACRFIVVTGQDHVDSSLLPKGHSCTVFHKPWDQQTLREAIKGRPGVAMHSSIPAPVSSSRTTTRVLILDPNRASAEELQTLLKISASEHLTAVAHTLGTAQALLREQPFDVACVDLDLPDANGMDAVVRLLSEQPDLGVVVMCNRDDEDYFLRAVQAGAQECVIRDRIDGKSLTRALRYARERKRAEVQLAQHALHDQLTGLASRTLFRQRVAQALSSASTSPFAVLWIDMDRFKAINDAFGHDTGDAFLQEIAARLRHSTRETDTVARLEGDNFAVLLRRASTRAEAQEIADALLSDLKRPAELNGSRVVPSASVGLAVSQGSKTTCDNLLAAAEAAARAAKMRGGNTLETYGEEVRSQARARIELEDKLHAALRRAEFSLEFQPQVDLAGNLISAEALLRWTRTPKRPVPAYQFISVLEQTGLISELGPFIIHTACRALRRWQDHGLPVRRVAVNLAAAQVAASDLLPLVEAALTESGLRPMNLELELTETSLVQDSPEVRTTLGQLKSLGCRIALDDFGTGFCSLSYLQRFPLSTIKVDRSYTEGITSPGPQRNLVGGMIHLAHRLGLDVVAEGVENEGQCEALRQESCDLMQGYLFGRSMTSDNFEKWATGEQSGANPTASKASGDTG